jgi:HEAT repeat protein
MRVLCATLIASAVVLATARASAEEWPGLEPEIALGLRWKLRLMDHGGHWHARDENESKLNYDAHRAWPVLAQQVREGDVETRRRAIHAMRAIKARVATAPAAIIPPLFDADRQVRDEAIMLVLGAAGWGEQYRDPLAKVLAPRLRPHVGRMLEEPDFAAWCAIMIAHLEGGADAALQRALWLASGHIDERIRKAAELAFGRHGDAVAHRIPLLIEQLGKPDSWRPASWVLGRGGPEAEAALREALRSDNAHRRTCALYCLRYRKRPLEPATVAALTVCIDDSSERFAESAVRALAAGKESSAPAAKDLAALLRSPNGRLEYAARDALHALGPAAAPVLPALIADARRAEGKQRADRVRGIGGIGPAGRAALPVLAELARSEDAAVAVEAACAAWKISGDLERWLPELRKFLARSPRGRPAWQPWAASRRVLRWVEELGPQAAPLLPDLLHAVEGGANRAVLDTLLRLPDQVVSAGATRYRAWLDHPTERLRFGACELLRRSGVPAAVYVETLRPLIRFGESRDLLLRVGLLRRIGEEGAPLWPELVPLLRIPNHNVGMDVPGWFAEMGEGGVQFLPVLRAHRPTAPSWQWAALDRTIAELEALGRNK